MQNILPMHYLLISRLAHQSISCKWSLRIKCSIPPHYQFNSRKDEIHKFIPNVYSLRIYLQDWSTNRNPKFLSKEQNHDLYWDTFHKARNHIRLSYIRQVVNFRCGLLHKWVIWWYRWECTSSRGYVGLDTTLDNKTTKYTKSRFQVMDTPTLLHRCETWLMTQRDYKNVSCWNKFPGSTRWCIQIDEIINKDRGNKL
jgi:hypothetical protein